MSSKIPILTRFYKHLWKLFLEDNDEEDKEILLDTDADLEDEEPRFNHAPESGTFLGHNDANYKGGDGSMKNIKHDIYFYPDDEDGDHTILARTGNHHDQVKPFAIEDIVSQLDRNPDNLYMKKLLDMVKNHPSIQKSWWKMKNF